MSTAMIRRTQCSWDRGTGGGMHFEGQDDIKHEGSLVKEALGGGGWEQSFGIKVVVPE